MTLKITYRDEFLRQVDMWLLATSVKFRELFGTVMRFLIGVSASIIVIGWIFEETLCWQIKRNCWNVLVIPETVLRDTKGAMRHIKKLI